MKNSQYWINRANQILADVHKNSDKYIAGINTAYDKALEDIQKDIEAIFRTYANNHNITATQAKRLLNSKISVKELDHLKKQIEQISNPELKKALLAQINANAYAARITRLEALKQSVAVHAKTLADKEIKLSSKAYIDTINMSYYKHVFNIQKGIGMGFSFAQLPTRAIELMLSTPWLGKNYSSRVWHNTDALANQLTKTITAGMISGKSNQKMARELQELMGYGKHAAERLVRTEVTYFCNQASIESYKECDVEKYMFVATLDLRTSKQCREHDRKIYNVKDAKPGENLPPLHPYCRSTTRAYLGEKYMQNIKRRARDPETGKTYLVDDMSYNEWHDKYVKMEGEKYSKEDYVNIEKTKVNWSNIRTDKWRKSFDKITDNRKVNNSIRRICKQILKHRDGTFYEDMYLINSKTGVIEGFNTMSNIKQTITLNHSLVSALENKSVDLIGIHNHPFSTIPSLGDLNAIAQRSNQSMGVIICHDGTIFKYSKPCRVIKEVEYKTYLTKHKKFSNITREDKGFRDMGEDFDFVFERIDVNG